MIQKKRKDKISYYKIIYQKPIKKKLMKTRLLVAPMGKESFVEIVVAVVVQLSRSLLAIASCCVLPTTRTIRELKKIFKLVRQWPIWRSSVLVNHKKKEKELLFQEQTKVKWLSQDQTIHVTFHRANMMKNNESTITLQSVFKQ